MVIVFAGMGLGQFLLLLGDRADLGLFVLVSALLSLAVVPLLLTASLAPVLVLAERLGLGEVYRASALGVLCAAGAGVGQGALFGMETVAAGGLGFDSAGVAVFMAAPLVGGLLSQVPVGRLSDRIDRRRLLVMLALAAGGVALPAVQANTVGPAALLAALGLLGGAMLPLYSLTIAHANDFLSPGQRVNASAALVPAAGLGLSVGPIAGATWMVATGPNGLFWALAAVHLALAGFAVYRMHRRSGRPPAWQAPYVVAPMRGSPLATELAFEQRDQNRSFERHRSLGPEGPPF